METNSAARTAIEVDAASRAALRVDESTIVGDADEGGVVMVVVGVSAVEVAVVADDDEEPAEPASPFPSDCCTCDDVSSGDDVDPSAPVCSVPLLVLAAVVAVVVDDDDDDETGDEGHHPSESSCNLLCCAGLLKAASSSEGIATGTNPGSHHSNLPWARAIEAEDKLYPRPPIFIPNIEEEEEEEEGEEGEEGEDTRDAQIAAETGNAACPRWRGRDTIAFTCVGTSKKAAAFATFAALNNPSSGRPEIIEYLRSSKIRSSCHW
jgi:hypothetical protein